MGSSSAKNPWVKTTVQGIYKRSDSGIYYARIFRNGKGTFRSLRTQTFSIAKQRLRKLALTVPTSSVNAASEAFTLADLAAIRRAEIDNDVALKPRSRDYYRECLDTIERTFPGFAKGPARLISRTDCQKWAAELSKVRSATRFNNTVGQLRLLFEVGISKEAFTENPARAIKRRPVRPKQLQLPSQLEFHALVAEIRSAGGRFSQACADLVQFLAYSGCRIGEVKFVTWGDCDLDRGVLTVKGEPGDGTKNREIRRIPMVDALKTLLLRLKSDGEPKALSACVMSVFECQKAIDRAVEVLKIERITHHDFRHLFATRCIESGVDIPTVSKWLGHKDGGALAMRVYGHLRQEHSIEQAKKVSF